ncbi:MAG TPA: ABC transporter permease [Desulfovibrio sp.]|uniref:ABC transporter permease n=1 Tax=Desulfovibrio sp. TaxID=885 RepID=UPI002C060865|nr:ABC transporter permease [Desulfovibrio sp.]HMM39122.1 ABC transporter permease [Desulfovibrio sp.]
MIRLEKRHGPPPLGGLPATGAALVLALVLGAAAFAALGADPLAAYAAMIRGALGYPGAFTEVLLKAAPLTLTGLAVALCCSLQVWNIGAEGQFVFGAVGAGLVGLRLWPEAGPWALIPACLLAGALLGGLWAGLAALLKTRCGVNEILSTLLLNYVAVIFMEHLYFGPWRDPAGFGFPGTAELPAASFLPVWPGTRLHLGLGLALACAALLLFLLRRTGFGYRARIIGHSPAAARYAGFRVERITVLALCLSGALAGLAGACEVLGMQHRLQDGLASGYGFDGIIVAFLARLHPLAVVPAAVFLGAAEVGGDQLQTALGLPGAVVAVIEAALLFGLLLGEWISGRRVVLGGADGGGRGQ